MLRDQVFAIPEHAVEGGPFVVTFMIDRKAPKRRGMDYERYRLVAHRPPSTEPVHIATKGPKFTVTLETAPVSPIRLAVGQISRDARGREVVAWTILRHVRAGEIEATFEFAEFGNTVLGLTDEEPK